MFKNTVIKCWELWIYSNKSSIVKTPFVIIFPLLRCQTDAFINISNPVFVIISGSTKGTPYLLSPTSLVGRTHLTPRTCYL